MSLRPSWFTERVSGQSELCKEIFHHKVNKVKQNTKDTIAILNKKYTARIMTISNFKLCYRALAVKTTLSVEGGAVGSGSQCGGWELWAVVFTVVVEMDYPLLPGVEYSILESVLFVYLSPVSIFSSIF